MYIEFEYWFSRIYFHRKAENTFWQGGFSLGTQKPFFSKLVGVHTTTSTKERSGGEK